MSSSFLSLLESPLPFCLRPRTRHDDERRLLRSLWGRPRPTDHGTEEVVLKNNITGVKDG